MEFEGNKLYCSYNLLKPTALTVLRPVLLLGFMQSELILLDWKVLFMILGPEIVLLEDKDQ